jgi:hypothetical protein
MTGPLGPQVLAGVGVAVAVGVAVGVAQALAADTGLVPAVGLGVVAGVVVLVPAGWVFEPAAGAPVDGPPLVGVLVADDEVLPLGEVVVVVPPPAIERSFATAAFACACRLDVSGR